MLFFVSQSRLLLRRLLLYFSMIFVTECSYYFRIFRLMDRDALGPLPFLCRCLACISSCFASVQDATELVAKLRAYHNTSQLQEDKVGVKSPYRSSDVSALPS